MSTVLEAIRNELAPLRLQVHRLECAEALLYPVCQPSEPQDLEPPRKSAARATPRRSSARNPTRAQLREYIDMHAPVARRDLLAAFGGKPQATDNKLKRMLQAGEIATDGRPGIRRYRPPDRPGILPRPEIVANTPLPDRGVYPVYDAIVDCNGATTGLLARQTGLPAHLVVEQGRRLMQLGLVRFTGAGRARKWLPTQSEIRSDAA